MKSKIRYCSNCNGKLRLANVRTVSLFNILLVTLIYWCDSCSHFIEITREKIVIKKGKKPIQWIN